MVTSSPSSQSQIGVPLHVLLFIFFFTNFITPSLSFYSQPVFTHSSSSFSSSSRVSYTEYCNSIVPKATPNSILISKSGFPQLESGFFNGGDKILAQNPNFSGDSSKSLSFRTQNVYKTDSDDVLMVELSLIFRLGSSFSGYGNFTFGRSKLGRFRTRRPRFPVRRNRVRFYLKGFWSESSGKLCMVGTGTGYSKQGNLLDLSAVFKLDYPTKNSTILTSLVTGSLESVDSADSANYFEPISVLSFSQRNYKYTLISKFNESGVSEGGDFQKDSVLGLEDGTSICSKFFRSSGFELEYGSDCFGTKNCSPLSSIGFLPEMIFFSEVQCSDDQTLRFVIGFPNSSYYVYNQPLVLGRMLVGEGVWDGENNRLSVVACQVLNYTGSLVNASVGDCSVRLSMWFPAILSIKSRSDIVGRLWSNKTVNESGYFESILFQSSKNRISAVPSLKYEYTEIERVVKSCPKKTAKKKGTRYPSGYSYDMRFDMRIKYDQRILAWGYAVPLSVGDQFYERSIGLVSESMAPESSVQMNVNQSSLINVSYSIRFTPDYQFGGGISSSNLSLDLNTPVEISAEGIYNTETGSLCMVGCRHVKSSNNHSMDCEILINIQFRSSDSKSPEYVKGAIQSIRERRDPLYFERLQFSAISLSQTQVDESVWRMDLEITLVLISNTLICIFVGLQIFYVKKHSDALPSISLVMLAILTLGQMIPLVLNFEAMFLTNRSRQNVMMGTGGWLEVNEVLVRVITMVSFLLQFRLLQLTWSSRSSDENRKGLVLAEKKALYVLLPLYLVGAFIAWGIHWWHNLQQGNITLPQGHSLWGDLRSYGGLLLDGFLLPQILFNVFWNSKDKALYPVFYVGISSVHLVPHAYDLYRAHRYVDYLNASYIYANPGGDFYSTAWDVIIPCGGLLFAILIYLQQRFGGCCILPTRFRQSSVYEKVPVASGE